MGVKRAYFPTGSSTCHCSTIFKHIQVFNNPWEPYAEICQPLSSAKQVHDGHSA